MSSAVRSARELTSIERDRLNALLAAAEIIDAELEGAYYAPDPNA